MDKNRGRKIRSEMALKGITAARIGRELGITPQAVSSVIYGRTSSSRVVDALIQAGVSARLFKEKAV